MANSYWTTPAASRIASPALHIGSGLGHWLGAAAKGLQYGQMVSVLNRLPDEYLAEAGLQRSDIPEHAHRLVYGRD
jgi:uncharacterized protein YjiS (DUF1127 family)